jgi:hypothetical protein
MRKLLIWRWGLALSILSSVVPSGSVLAQGSVQWGCDAPVGKICYFSIQFAGGGARNFSLPAGRRMMVGGVTPGRDQYLVSIDVPNGGDIRRCRQLIAVGRSCQVKAVDPNYND